MFENIFLNKYYQLVFGFLNIFIKKNSKGIKSLYQKSKNIINLFKNIVENNLFLVLMWLEIKFKKIFFDESFN